MGDGEGETAVGRGTYVLVFRVAPEISTRFGELLGGYCYVGSAMGPGGISARVGRHLRERKVLKWHIDHITASPSFDPVAVYATSDPVECFVASSLARSHRGIPGFGCSDCRCASHLFAVEDPGQLERELLGLGLVKVRLEAIGG